MRDAIEELGLGNQALKNLHFLIELHLREVSTLTDDSREAADAHAMLRRLMDLEDTLHRPAAPQGARHEAPRHFPSGLTIV